jgi:hypothetical protein
MHNDRYAAGGVPLVLRLLGSSAAVTEQPACGRVHLNFPVDHRGNRQMHFLLYHVVLTHARSAPAADSYGICVTRCQGQGAVLGNCAVKAKHQTFSA